jgi:hypothetical protein
LQNFIYSCVYTHIQNYTHPVHVHLFIHSVFFHYICNGWQPFLWSLQVLQKVWIGSSTTFRWQTFYTAFLSVIDNVIFFSQFINKIPLCLKYSNPSISVVRKTCIFKFMLVCGRGALFRAYFIFVCIQCIFCVV